MNKILNIERRARNFEWWSKRELYAA